MVTRPHAAIGAALLLVITLLFARGAGPARAGGAVWNYPADCVSVQACIDAASPGDSVFMFANSAAESVSINKSLQLKSGNATQYQLNYLSVADPPASSPMFVTVAGLSVANMSLYFNSSVGSSVIARNMLGRGVAGESTTFYVDVETSATMTIENSVAKAAGESNALGMVAYPNGGQVNLRVVGNRFDGHSSASSRSGIALTALTSGNVVADIYNNSIWDAPRGATGSAGIFLSVSGTVHADVNVVGNTVEKSATDGLQQRNTLAAGGHLALDVFNNVFAHAKDFGVRLDAGLAGTMTFRAGFNNYFMNEDGNQRDGLSLGSNNLALNPGFVSASTGNLRLTSTSKLINKGQVCSPGGVASPDAANRRRVNGSTVDIGAYERGALTGPVWVVLGTSGNDVQLGTTGPDILCGYGGMDQQLAYGGNDFIDGGDANDFQYGGLGADRMLGGSGADILCADDGKNIDFLNGGAGTDKFRADSGDTKKSVEQPAGTACDP